MERSRPRNENDRLEGSTDNSVYGINFRPFRDAGAPKLENLHKEDHFQYTWKYNFLPIKKLAVLKACHDVL